MCSALGLRGLLGAEKRRMLSFAETPSDLAEALPLTPFVLAADILPVLPIESVTCSADWKLFFRLILKTHPPLMN